MSNELQVESLNFSVAEGETLIITEADLLAGASFNTTEGNPRNLRINNVSVDGNSERFSPGELTKINDTTWEYAPSGFDGEDFNGSLNLSVEYSYDVTSFGSVIQQFAQFEYSDGLVVTPVSDAPSQQIFDEYDFKQQYSATEDQPFVITQQQILQQGNWDDADLSSRDIEVNQQQLTVVDLQIENATVTQNENGDFVVTFPENFNSGSFDSGALLIGSYSVSDPEGNVTQAQDSIELYVNPEFDGTTVDSEVPTISGQIIQEGTLTKLVFDYTSILDGVSNPDVDLSQIVAQNISISNISNAFDSYSFLPKDDGTIEVVLRAGSSSAGEIVEYEFSGQFVAPDLYDANKEQSISFNKNFRVDVPEFTSSFSSISADQVITGGQSVTETIDIRELVGYAEGAYLRTDFVQNGVSVSIEETSETGVFEVTSTIDSSYNGPNTDFGVGLALVTPVQDEFGSYTREFSFNYIYDVIIAGQDGVGNEIELVDGAPNYIKATDGPLDRGSITDKFTFDTEVVRVTTIDGENVPLNEDLGAFVIDQAADDLSSNVYISYALDESGNEYVYSVSKSVVADVNNTITFADDVSGAVIGNGADKSLDIYINAPGGDIEDSFEGFFEVEKVEAAFPAVDRSLFGGFTLGQDFSFSEADVLGLLKTTDGSDLSIERLSLLNAGSLSFDEETRNYTVTFDEGVTEDNLEGNGSLEFRLTVDNGTPGDSEVNIEFFLYENGGTVSPSLGIEAGVEGEDFIFSKYQKVNDNNNIGKRGFDADGNYWIKTKNGYDELIGNGQEVAFIAGSKDVVRGKNGSSLSAEDVLTGLEDGSLVASRSFASYDGIFNVANFEAGSLDELMTMGEQVNLTRIDAGTGEQLGGSFILDPTRTYDLGGNEFTNSLSAQNGNDFGSIIAADPTLGLI